MTLDDPQTSRQAFAGVSALTVLVWYALPDAVRSRPVRGVIKAALLAVGAAGSAVIPQVFPEAKGFRRKPRVDVPAPVLTALGVAAAAAVTAGTLSLEKAIYARGERQRARGVPAAHTRVAAALALATGAAALVDWARLAGSAARH